VDASKGSSVEDKAFHQSCMGVLFFGAPHQGLNPTSIESLVKGKGNERFLQDRSTGSDYLFELQKDFRICHETMENPVIIVSFYESEDTCSIEVSDSISKKEDKFKFRRDTNVRKKIPDGGWKRSGPPIRMVPRESAVCSVSRDKNIMEVRADHSKMVRFWSESDEHYQRVIVKIKEMTSVYEMRGLERLQGGSSEDSRY
jgi:hypothetical protein